MKVSELIEQLQKMPQEAHVGFYASNAYNRGDANWMNYIKYVEKYKGDLQHPGEVVALIGGVA
jgi:hypothetical protein